MRMYNICDWLPYVLTTITVTTENTVPPESLFILSRNTIHKKLPLLPTIFLSVFAAVKILCTLHVLLNIAPNATEKPMVRTAVFN